MERHAYGTRQNHLFSHRLAQNRLFRDTAISHANRELLKTFSIDYPPFQEAQKTVATHGNFSLFLAALREGNQARLAQAVAHCAASPCRNIIFSEEQLTMLSKDKLKELCALFHEFPIKIICYLRRQDHHHTSLANQMTFAAGITDFSAPLTGAFAVFNDLSQLVEIFEEIFGKENMIFRIYEKQQFHGGNLFADFLDIFHVPLNEAFSLPERVNPPLAPGFSGNSPAVQYIAASTFLCA